MNYFSLNSSETLSFFLPLARLRARTLRPFLLLIRSLKPCLFFLLRLDGWNVRFILRAFYNWAANLAFILRI